MTPAPEFAGLIRRVRAGDPAAAEELVRRYEPAVRRAVRFRLTDDRLGRLLDSVDVCQSVLASFFVRAALGQYELETPDQLVKLLGQMARNKLANAVNRERAGRRDYRRAVGGDTEAGRAAAAGPSPSEQVAAADLLAETTRRLGPDERRVLVLRQQGLGWAAIAGEVGGTPEGVRKRFDRAVERVAEELGLEG
jgi:RNA polymerase sigma-70 factor (ECF subfamily)